MHIRNSAKAVILRGEKLLLTKNIDDKGFFYIFPGGGQEHGENLTEAVKRECLEEAGATVHVDELIFIREYIGKNHEHSASDTAIHQIEYYFLCELTGEKERFNTPTNPDLNQVGIEWISVSELHNYRIYPKAIIHPIQQRTEGIRSSVYLGDVN